MVRRRQPQQAAQRLGQLPQRCLLHEPEPVRGRGRGGSTNPSTPISQTLVESWNGSTWSITPSPTPSPTTLAELQAVSCVNSVSCVAVGSNENSAAGTDFSLIETWNGSVWSITPHPDSSYGYFYGVSCASSSVCLAVGYPEESGPPPSPSIAPDDTPGSAPGVSWRLCRNSPQLADPRGTWPVSEYLQGSRQWARWHSRHAALCARETTSP